MLNRTNCVTEIAKQSNRNYIVPSDVVMALKLYNANIVRLAVLAVIGHQTKFTVENEELCAFIAYEGVVDLMS